MTIRTCAETEISSALELRRRSWRARHRDAGLYSSGTSLGSSPPEKKQYRRFRCCCTVKTRTLHLVHVLTRQAVLTPREQLVESGRVHFAVWFGNELVFCIIWCLFSEICKFLFYRISTHSKECRQELFCVIFYQVLKKILKAAYHSCERLLISGVKPHLFSLFVVYLIKTRVLSVINYWRILSEHYF